MQLQLELDADELQDVNRSSQFRISHCSILIGSSRGKKLYKLQRLVSYRLYATLPTLGSVAQR
jgi:hypothetical protein